MSHPSFAYLIIFWLGKPHPTSIENSARTKHAFSILAVHFLLGQLELAVNFFLIILAKINHEYQNVLHHSFYQMIEDTVDYLQVK